MNIVSLENVTKTYGFKPLVESASFGLDSSDRVGLIGRNGSGKTTLLRMIAGVETPDSGRIVTSRELTIGYLAQNPAYEPDETVLDAVFPSTSDAMRLVHDYELACRELAEAGGTDDRLLERVAVLTDRIGHEGGWDLEANARIVLTKLGVSDTRARMGTLSGGQRRRVALAGVLIARPGLLLLDEPTNHLDAETIEWLEQYLASYSGALLLVTHDRYFLDRVTNRILEVDRGVVQGYDGNYAYYVEKKAEQEHARATEDSRRVVMLRRELEWLARGARARTTKEKARIRHVEELRAGARDDHQREVEISVASSRLGTKVIELEDASKAYGDNVLFRDFTYTLKRRDRIGIVGPNGSGKTTLLDVFAGRMAPDSGSVETGQTVVVGYYDQEIRDFDPEQRALDYVGEVAGRVETADGSTISAGQMLERFLFPPDMQYAPVGKFSGGERRRLFLVRILMTSPNVLLLDEPTNDLDIETLVRLEEYLDSFPGALVVVSHDRYFLDRTVEHVFHFEGGGRVRNYPGNYSAFREAQAREQAERMAAEAPAPRSAKTAPAESPAAGPRKLSYKEQREFEELEARIATSEARKAAIEAELAASASDYVALQELTAELEALDSQLERDVERWAELAERA